MTACSVWKLFKRIKFLLFALLCLQGFLTSSLTYALLVQKILDRDSRDWVDLLLVHEHRLFVADSINDSPNIFNTSQSAWQSSIQIIDLKSTVRAGKIPVANSPEIPIATKIEDMVAFGNRLFVGTTQHGVVPIINIQKARIAKNLAIAPPLTSVTGLSIYGQRLYISDHGTKLILPVQAMTLKHSQAIYTGDDWVDPDGTYHPLGTPTKICVAQDKLFMITRRLYHIPSLDFLRILDLNTGRDLFKFDGLDGGVIGDYKPRGYTALHLHTDQKVYALAPFVFSKGNSSHELSGSVVIGFSPSNLKDVQILRLEGAWFPLAMASLGDLLLVLDRGSLDGAVFSKLFVLNPKNAANLLVRVIDLNAVSQGAIRIARGMATSPEGEVFIDSEQNVSVLTGL